MAERKLNDFELDLCFGSRLVKSLFPFHYKVVVFSLESCMLEILYTAGRSAARNPQIGHRLEAGYTTSFWLCPLEPQFPPL